MSDARRASGADWVAVFAGALGALLATLDTSIVNSALPTIQGEIGATGTEGTWISTGYLVSEVIIIPLTAWLSRLLGLRTLLLTSAITFTSWSMLCGASTTLVLMIIGRVGQGFFGGALIPTAQTIIRTRLPQAQLPVGMTIFGLIVMLGPLLGPVIGGWLTNNVSWRWCFFINLPVACGLVALLLAGVPYERPKIEFLHDADWLGIASMTVFLGALTIMLEEGQRDHWFSSPLVTWLAIACVAGLVALLFAERHARRPVLKLHLLRNVNYTGVLVIVIAVGGGLYGNSYTMPQFLSNIAGYNAGQSGRILIISGIPMFLMMPILPRLLARMNLQLSVTVGLGFFAGGCLVASHLTSLSDGSAFVLSQLMTGTGMMLAMFPLNQASVGSVGREDAADAAGLYNMARNLGGSLGLAGLGILIDRRSELHDANIRASIDANAPLVQARISDMAATFTGTDPAYAHTQALARLAADVQTQAMVMTYSDCFRVSAFVLLACIPLVLLLRAPPRRPQAGGHH